MYNIFVILENETIKYASRELAKYLTLITKNDNFKISFKQNYDENLKGIWLCKGLDLNINFDVEDLEKDDAVKINIKKCSGYIVGSNERSVLIGVYRFLSELGCKFLRPCKDGEILVNKEIDKINVCLEEKASLRHRGIVIEGANSYENVVDIIDWLPKIYCNSYFMQFKYGYTFFKQWYSHKNNPYKDKEFFDEDMCIEFTENIAKEIKKRGLIYHAVGHGWTCETVGIVGKGWDSDTKDLDESKKEFLALINGKRDFFGGVPLNTNLCYSSKDVQENFAQVIINYVKQNKYADVIHIWLADAYNNHCECENCKKLSPTDWYVECLNVIDEHLTKQGLNIKIAFLLYFELLWKPIKVKIKNPDRFLLMFAPISRTFNKSYKECESSIGKMLEFKLNENVLPTKVEDYIKYLKDWQQIFNGDSFDFDYHLGRAHYGDAGYYKISKLISEDIKTLKELSLNGLLSCQEQRCFFPTALPNYVMGQTLWNTDLTFDKLAEDYFKYSFGKDYEKCKKYLEHISDIFDIDYWQIKHCCKDEKMVSKFEKVESIVSEFEKVCLENQNHLNITEKLSWKYIYYHLNYTKYFANVLMYRAFGDNEKASKEFIKFRDFICKNEDEIQRALDIYRVLEISKGIKLSCN